MILTGDFRELSQDLTDVDMILTDPPYENKSLPLWSDLAEMAARVLRPGGWCIAYSGAMFLPEVMQRMAEHLEYFWLGGLRHPGGNARMWCKAVFEVMKPILFYRKRPVPSVNKRWFANLVNSEKRDKRFHPWGQAVGPLRYFIERLTDPGDLIVDPFLGGGTTAVAALQTGRRCIGYEIDADMAEIARGRAEAQPPLFIPDVVEQLVMCHAAQNYKTGIITI